MENKQPDTERDPERFQEAFENLKTEIIHSPFGQVTKKAVYGTLDKLNKLINFFERRFSE